MTHGEFFTVLLVLNLWALRYKPQNDKAQGAQFCVNSKNDSLKCNVRFSNSFFFFFFFFFGLVFLELHRGIWRFPGQGSNRSCRCWPTPEPQQRQIWAISATYTTAHGNTGSLTHWARTGIKPNTSWFLVGFVSAVPRWELQILKFFNIA